MGEQEGSPQYPGPSEFYVVVTRKIPKPLEPGRAREIVESLLYWDMVVNDPEAVLEAIDLSEKHRLSFWDALVVQAAVVAGAEVLFSEDLNPGQVIEGVRVENPF
ncbi:MAG: PIN domain nuclease [Aquificota bacterium]|nr:MAG: PIN domain nuclease [Aquificota bacterium]